MAGGALASEVPCMVCLTERKLTKATRVVEGIEDDQYLCSEGHQFGMDWSRGEAAEAQWPPSAELKAFVAGNN
jgi:hypothetical protein